VISNLVHQLAELGLRDRLDEVLDETVRVRADMGYPIMITPHSQFVVTQSAINVAQGERYKVVIDELILFAMGVYGEDSGAPWMDQDLKDRLLSLPRAGELKSLGDDERRDMSLPELRRKMGGEGLSDDEFLLRCIMKGESEIQAMRDAGRPKRYSDAGQPLAALLDKLGKQGGVRYIHLQRGTDRLMLENRSRA
jgi:oxaloacetate decarboxylase alpha subunit